MADFREYAERRDELETAKAAILNALGATPAAMGDPLSNFKAFRQLTDRGRNPQLADMIDAAPNREAIVTAVKNAGATRLSIADLVALFAAGSTGKLAGGRTAAPAAKAGPPAPPPQKQ